MRVFTLLEERMVEEEMVALESLCCTRWRGCWEAGEGMGKQEQSLLSLNKSVQIPQCVVGVGTMIKRQCGKDSDRSGDPQRTQSEGGLMSEPGYYQPQLPTLSLCSQQNEGKKQKVEDYNTNVVIPMMCSGVPKVERWVRIRG